MQLNPGSYACQTYQKPQRDAGFTIAEVMVGLGVLGLLAIAMFGLLASGFSIIRFNRENLRATQIMVNRLEGLRLYNWSQLDEVPTTFTEYYYPLGTSNQTSGTVYAGTVSITAAAPYPPATYGASMMRLVTVQLAWTNGAVTHQRRLSTYVGQYGIQNYVFKDDTL
jgi:hypothetical protein